MITKFKIFEEKEIIYDGEFVANYVIDISEEAGNDPPDFFISEYIKPSNFILTKVKISELSKSDEDFNEYLVGDDDRYEDYHDDDFDNEYPDYDNLFNPIVVFNDVVLDGYNRMTILKREDIDEVNAYVNIDNKNEKI